MDAQVALYNYAAISFIHPEKTSAMLGNTSWEREETSKCESQAGTPDAHLV
jgi:hypothetical protein